MGGGGEVADGSGMKVTTDLTFSYLPPGVAKNRDREATPQYCSKTNHNIAQIMTTVDGTDLLCARAFDILTTNTNMR